jgi:hypothetical protein
MFELLANWPATLFSFLRISNLMNIRLSFGIVHLIIYATISKITVRPREIGTEGTGGTSNHDNGAHEAQTLLCIP